MKTMPAVMANSTITTGIARVNRGGDGYYHRRDDGGADYRCHRGYAHASDHGDDRRIYTRYHGLAHHHDAAWFAQNLLAHGGDYDRS